MDFKSAKFESDIKSYPDRQNLGEERQYSEKTVFLLVPLGSPSLRMAVSLGQMAREDAMETRTVKRASPARFKRSRSQAS